MTVDIHPVRRALISVSDKTGIVEFAQALHAQGIELLSTGGTYRLLKENNLPAVEVADYTGFPEMMDGRVKTLHPKIHGGILGRRNIDNDIMAEHQINPIDLIVINLYPFKATTAREDCNLDMAIENIDIGGPAMVRSSAKNHAWTTILVDPTDYDQVLTELQDGGTRFKTRFNLALKAFEHTSAYDGMIANYLGSIRQDADQISTDNRLEYPRTLNTQFQLAQTMRYGENPHQTAAFYTDPNNLEPSVSTAKQHQGKELSFNNVADTDAALETVKSFTIPACVIVKHANPCGVATADSIQAAYDKAFKTDPTSAFGGIIAFNLPVDANTAKAITERQFVEVVIAPSYEKAALAIFAAKPNVRVLSCGEFQPSRIDWDYKKVTGGLLVQQKDQGIITASDLKVVTKKQPTEDQIRDLLFAWTVCKFVKSNAIVFARDGMTLGVGAGQMSRVYSTKIAAIKAGDEQLELAGSVMASDAFFPFRDGLDQAASVGIGAVIQPGGSMRDEEVIEAANEHGLAMVFTGMRHFRH